MDNLKHPQPVKKSSLSISLQIPLLLGGILLFYLCLTSAVSIWKITQVSEQQFQKLGNILVEQTATAARDSLVAGDHLSLNVILSQLTLSEMVTRATIYNIDDKPIASTESKDYDASKNYALFSAQIDYQNVIVGELQLELKKVHLKYPDQQLYWVLLGIAVLGLIGIVMVWIYAKKRQRILARAVRQLQGMAKGHIAYGAKVKNEITQLSAQLDYLIAQEFSQASSQKPHQEPACEEAIVTLSPEPLPELHPEPVAIIEEPIVGPVEAEEPEKSIILAIRLSNLHDLHRSLNQAALITLMEKQLPFIAYAAKRHNGELQYSAEGNAYIAISTQPGINQTIFQAICCAQLVQELLHQAKENDGVSFEVELGISTIQPQTPGSEHPSLIDAATSQALMLARLGRGRLLLDGHYNNERQREIKVTLHKTTFGDDIFEVSPLPSRLQPVLKNKTEHIHS